MPEAVVSRVKNTVFVESGRRGGLTRWGGRRIARLDSLSQPVRAAVEALIAADLAAKSAQTEQSAPADSRAEALTSEARDAARSTD